MSAGYNFLFIDRAKKKSIIWISDSISRISKLFQMLSKYSKHSKKKPNWGLLGFISPEFLARKNRSIFQVYWLVGLLTWICHLAGQRYRVSHSEFERLRSREEQWLIFIQDLVGGFNCKEKENWNSIKNLFKSNFLKLLQNKCAKKKFNSRGSKKTDTILNWNRNCEIPSKSFLNIFYVIFTTDCSLLELLFLFSWIIPYDRMLPGLYLSAINIKSNSIFIQIE